MRYWTNPEFVRHLRAELRPARAITVLVIVAVICALVYLACWGSREQDLAVRHRIAKNYHAISPQALEEFERQSPVVVAQHFYQALMIALLGVLSFWSLLSCAQAISGERERKTWDFQRSTRLSPTELLIGKLLGEPIMAYFIVACCFPVALFAGLYSQFRLRDVLAAYLLIGSAGLFAGLLGLWMSSLFEAKSRGVGLIGTIGLYVGLGLSFYMVSSDFPGLASFSCLAALLPLVDHDFLATFGNSRYETAIFGKLIPWTAMTLVLYLLFGSLLALMLLRNIKRDYDDACQLSRWQAVGCVAFLNLLFYALHYPQRFSSLWDYNFAAFMVALNIPILLAMGLATLSSYERLKVWYRERAKQRASVLDEDGLTWPWLVLSAAIIYTMLALFARRFGIPVDALKAASIQVLVVLVFITRDVLFIQWCRLTRMRAPVLKGVLFLGLYYIASVVVVVVVGINGSAASQQILRLLTPFDVLGPQRNGFHFAKTVFAGMGVHFAVAVALLYSISRRFARPAVALATSGD